MKLLMAVSSPLNGDSVSASLQGCAFHPAGNSSQHLHHVYKALPHGAVVLKLCARVLKCSTEGPSWGVISGVEVKTSGLGLGPPPTSPSDHFYEVESVQDFC